MEKPGQQGRRDRFPNQNPNPEPETEPDENTEIKWITVKGITNIAMGVIYGKQESASANEAEEQFQNLTTQVNLYQKTHKVILLGDLNAKIEMKTQDKPGCNQQTSRNGKMLDNLINNTNTTVVNKLSTHQGTWTRVNRKNNKEKSIIDYIIVSKSIEDKVTESKTDAGQEYLITGLNPTDHNVITATIDTKMQTNQEKTRKWKTGTKEQWKIFNQMLKDQWEKEHQPNKNINTLQKNITTCMENSIVSKITSNNKKVKISNPKIKIAKQQRKKRQIQTHASMCGENIPTY